MKDSFHNPDNDNSKPGRKIGILIMLVAMFTGIFSVCAFNRDVVLVDASEYHTLAINLLEGNGYSLDSQAPYEPTFYREPGYVASLLVPLGAYSVFNDLEYIEQSPDIHQRSVVVESVEWVKYFQVLVFALICLLQYATLRYVLNPKTAAIIALATSLFMPLAIYTTYMMRELVLTLFMMAMNFFIVRYYFERKIINLVLAGVFGGLAALSLQVMVFSVVFVLAFIVYANPRKLKAILLGWIVFLASVLLTLTPWMLRTYSYYPDIRVAHNIGTNLTFDKMKYINSLRALRRHGIITQSELTAIEYQTYDNGLKGFEDTFSGKYDAMADSNYTLIASRGLKKGSVFTRLKQYGKKYGRHVFTSGYLLSFVRRPMVAKSLKIILYILSFIMGFAYLAGIISHTKKLLPVLTVYLFMFASIVTLSGRRLLPIYPYFVTFTVLGAMWIREKMISWLSLWRLRRAARYN